MRLSVALLITCLLAGPARAEPDLISETAAHARIERGIALYRRGQLDEAILEWNGAYAATRAPTLLFDLGQAYRKKGDLAMAITSYRGYLRASPDAPDADAVRSQVGVLEDQLRHDTAAPGPSPLAMPRVTSTPRPSHNRAALIAAITSTGSLGLLALGVGGALMARAQADAEALTGAPRGAKFDDYRDRYEDGRASTGGAIGLFVLGGAAIVGAVTTAIVERRALQPPPRVAFREGRWVF